MSNNDPQNPHNNQKPILPPINSVQPPNLGQNNLYVETQQQQYHYPSQRQQSPAPNSGSSNPAHNPPPPAYPHDSNSHYHDSHSSTFHDTNHPPSYNHDSAAIETTGPPQARPLNVRDALSYLDQVKWQFGNQPEVYNRFLDIMKDFKSQEIDTPGVIERVSTLFRAHPRLIYGFNTFLPPGFSLEPTGNPNDPVRVITPRDRESSIPAQPPRDPAYNPRPTTYYPHNNSPAETTREPEYSSQTVPPITSSQSNYHPTLTGASNIINSMNPQTVRRPAEQGRQRGPVEFNHAINYVNKIKTRFANQPETYRFFLEILQTYQREDKPIQEVYSQVQYLFAGAPDLLEEFKQFLPDNSPTAAQPPAAAAVPAAPNTASTVPPTLPKPNIPPPIKKQAKRNAIPPPHYYPQPVVPGPPPKKKVKVGKPEKPTSAEEAEFFEKVKKIIPNRATYNEFLKLLNLYSQEIIEAKVLIERAEPFLSKSPELFDWFKRFVKYEPENNVITNVPAEKPNYDLKSWKQSGHSYRRMPNHHVRPSCSGRDELCKEVLNNDWLSTTVFLSENGFQAHKKTPNEDSMYKCEEERYEFDVNIEANLSVINLLKPIAHKIMLMTQEEKANFKLAPGLGGYSTTIYKRIIKKIYDSERGLEVIDALHNNPAVAVPIVLKRLIQKDEEWKRSQREWNKVWREIDAKNFSKALDHQGINFKATDRKAILPKSLINEIEVLQLEQKEKKSNLPNRYQFDFTFKNREMFKHVHNILINYVENAQNIPTTEEEKIRSLLTDHIPKMFMLEEEEDNAESAQDSVMDTDEPFENSTALDGTEAENGQDGTVPAKNKKRSSHTLYANNTLYVFIRLYQMLYSRLVRMNEVSDQLIGQKTRSENKNQVAVDLGFRSEASKPYTEKDRFSELLKDIELFVNNDMDANDFEDKTRELFWTSGYIIFTVDKLVQAIVKQMQAIASDSKCLELLTIYTRDREKNTTGPRQEALYRLCAEQIIQDENIYRMEYFIAENVLTIQLLGKEDQVTDDTISSEEKWSLYVDQFVQLSSNENANFKSRNPFCKRCLPTHVGEDPPLNVETKSGLELKICVNTYKIFFVDNTEDYFRRKRSANVSSLIGRTVSERTTAENQMRQKRFNKFRQWLDSPAGWKQSLPEEEAKKLDDSFNNWITGNGKADVEEVKNESESYRIVKDEVNDVEMA